MKASIKVELVLSIYLVPTTLPFVELITARCVNIDEESPYKNKANSSCPSLLRRVSPQSLFQEAVGHDILFAQLTEVILNVILYIWRLQGDADSVEIKNNSESLNIIWLYG